MPQRPFAGPDADVRALISAADVAFVNFEGPLTDRRAPSDTVAWVRGDPALAQDVAATGIVVASLANNHAADFGTDGLFDTIAALEGAGVRTVGAGTNLDQALMPSIVHANGLRVAFLGFACTLPNGCAAGDQRPGVAPIRVLSRFVIDPVVLEQNPGMGPYVETVASAEDVDQAASAIALANESADVVVVAIHWGVPDGWAPSYQSELASYQRPLGHRLIDAGADAVIGHHPHVLHGIEIYRGRPVFYSLGNFLFHSLVSGELVAARSYPPYDFTRLRSRLGGLARLTWTQPGAPDLIELGIVRLDEFGNPHPGSGADVAEAFERVRPLSAALRTRVARPEAGRSWFKVASA